MVKLFFKFFTFFYSNIVICKNGEDYYYYYYFYWYYYRIAKFSGQSPRGVVAKVRDCDIVVR